MAKQFLIIIGKSLLFVGLLLGVAKLTQANLPYYWANDDFEYKYDYFAPIASEYNVLFFGSSATYRHVIPSIFDNRAPESLRCKSFNFGVQAMVNPEGPFILRQMLKDPNLDLSNVKLIIMDMQEVSDLSLNNAMTPRGKYYLDWKSLQNEIYPQLDEAYPNPIKYKQNYFYAWLGKQFNVGLYTDIWDWHEKQNAPLDSGRFRKSLGGKLDGYYPLNRDFRFAWRNEQYMPDAEQDLMETMYKSIDHIMCEDQEGFKIIRRRQMRELYIELIRDCKRKGIHLILVLQPRLDTRSMYPVLTYLPEEHSLNMADPREFPEFYDIENVFDKGHFNHSGARAFTIGMMQKLKPRLDSLGTLWYDTPDSTALVDSLVTEAAIE